MSEERDLRNEDVLRDISTKVGTLLANQTDLRDDIKEIKTQTIKTNGRVGRLENWRSYMSGAIAIITFLFVAYLRAHE